MSKKSKPILDKMEWLNPPKTWSVKNNTLSMIARPKSDFWQNTHYGFSLDTGSFYYTKCKGEFEVSVKIKGEFKTQYDQMGIMIRIDEETWLKTGIEYVDNQLNISAVSTQVNSDWSMIKLNEVPNEISFKVIRKSDALEIYYSLNHEPFSMMRLSYFPKKTRCMVGLMSASPKGNGFKAVFKDFNFEDLSDL